jgi:hypothetical protein
VSEGGEWPAQGLRTSVVRGFNVVQWSDGSQRFALVSDLNLPELLQLKARVAP